MRTFSRSTVRGQTSLSPVEATLHGYIVSKHVLPEENHGVFFWCGRFRVPLSGVKRHFHLLKRPCTATLFPNTFSQKKTIVFVFFWVKTFSRSTVMGQTSLSPVQATLQSYIGSLSTRYKKVVLTGHVQHHSFSRVVASGLL